MLSLMGFHVYAWTFCMLTLMGFHVYAWCFCMLTLMGLDGCTLDILHA